MTWFDPTKCKYCDRRPRKNKTRCSFCAEQENHKQKQLREQKKANGFCVQNGCKNKARVNRTTCEACAKLRSRRDRSLDIARELEARRKSPFKRQKHNVTTRAAQRKIVESIFRKYGNRCNSVNCLWVNIDGSKGCTDARCLQVDHVKGGGSKEVKEISYTVRLRKILEDETGAYQLLCANCNWIKRHVNDESKKGHFK